MTATETVHMTQTLNRTRELLMKKILGMSKALLFVIPDYTASISDRLHTEDKIRLLMKNYIDDGGGGGGDVEDFVGSLPC